MIEDETEKKQRRYSDNCSLSLRDRKFNKDKNPQNRFSTPHDSINKMHKLTLKPNDYHSFSDLTILKERKNLSLRTISRKLLNIMKFVKNSSSTSTHKTLTTTENYTNQNIDDDLFASDLYKSNRQRENNSLKKPKKESKSKATLFINDTNLPISSDIFINDSQVVKTKTLLNALPTLFIQSLPSEIAVNSDGDLKRIRSYNNVYNEVDNEDSKNSTTGANSNIHKRQIVHSASNGNDSNFDISHNFAQINTKYNTQGDDTKELLCHKNSAKDKKLNQKNSSTSKTTTTNSSFNKEISLNDASNTDSLITDDGSKMAFQYIKKHSSHSNKIKTITHKRVQSIPVIMNLLRGSNNKKSNVSFKVSSHESSATLSNTNSSNKSKNRDRFIDDLNKDSGSSKTDKRFDQYDHNTISFRTKSSTFGRKLFRSDDHICLTCKDSFIVNSATNKFYKIFSIKKSPHSNNSLLQSKKRVTFVDEKPTDISLKSVELDSKNSEEFLNVSEYLNEMVTSQDVPPLSCTITSDRKTSDSRKSFGPTFSYQKTNDELMDLFCLPQNFKLFLNFGVLHNCTTLTFFIEKISVQQFAEQLNYLDQQYLLMIEWEEIKSGAWLAKNKHVVAKNIMQSIHHFNRISRFIANTIISTKKVGEELFNTKNFNGLQEVLGALSMHSVYRLEETWKGLHPVILKKYDIISTYMDSRNNFKEYRDNVTNAIEKKIQFMPFMGIFLSDVNAHINYNKNGPSGENKTTSHDSKQCVYSKSNSSFLLFHRRRFSVHEFFKNLSLVDNDYWYKPPSSIMENDTFIDSSPIDNKEESNNFNNRNLENTSEPHSVPKTRLNKAYSIGQSTSSNTRKLIFYEPHINPIVKKSGNEENLHEEKDESNKIIKGSSDYLIKLIEIFLTYRTNIKNYQINPCNILCTYLLCCQLPDEETLYKESCEIEPSSVCK